MKPPSANVAAYIRVSTIEQEREGVSLEAQTEACKREAAKRGLEPPVVYEDVQSAKNTARPALQRLLAACKAGVHRTLIVYSLDRLSRDIRDSLALVDDLDRAGVEIVFLVDPTDRSTPAGELLFHIKAALSQHERKQIAQRVRHAMHGLVERGEYCGRRPPYGYRISGHRQLEIDPETAPILIRMYEWFAAGESMRGIKDRLNAEGIPGNQRGKPWGHSSVRGILTNTVYGGVQEWGNTRGVWPFPSPIPPELYERVQRRLLQRKHQYGPIPRRSEWSGLLRCGYCGLRLAHSKARPWKYEPKNIFVCRCGKVKINVDYLEALTRHILTLVSECSPPPRRKPKPAPDVAGQLEDIERREANARWEFRDLGTMSREEYEATIRECRARRQALEVPATGPTLKKVKTLPRLWEGLTVEERIIEWRDLVRVAVVSKESVTVLLVPWGWTGWPEELTISRDSLRRGA